jgi:hypothetical protein
MFPRYSSIVQRLQIERQAYVHVQRLCRTTARYISFTPYGLHRDGLSDCYARVFERVARNSALLLVLAIC